MSMIRVAFLASALILSGCEAPSPKKMNEMPSREVKSPEVKLLELKPPEVKIQVEMSTVNRQAKITASNSDGKEISAKNNYNHTWSVNDSNAVGGMIFVDPLTKEAKYQSSSMTSPVQSMVIYPNGSIETTEYNVFGSKKTIVIDSSRNVTRVEITNSPKEILVAKKASEGIWNISGTDVSGKSVKGILEIDVSTGFIAYKGSNGSFIYKELIPIDSVVAGMSLVRGDLTEESIAKQLLDVSHRRSALTNQVEDLLLAIMSKIGKP